MRILTASHPTLRDLGLLLARVILGIVLIAHGWQKLTTWGISGTAASFTKMGVPAAHLSAAFAAIVEFAGGIALILGILTPVVALLVVLDMFGAFLFVHSGHGVFIDGGGWELVGVIGAASLALLGGAGRFSLDHLLNRRHATAAATTSGATAADERELVNA